MRGSVPHYGINEFFCFLYFCDPISTYLFIIALEVLFILIKNKDNIKGIDLYDHSFLFTAYADDSTFFLKDVVSVRVLIDTFKLFSCFLWTKT